jgi:hypothetical protein
MDEQQAITVNNSFNFILQQPDWQVANGAFQLNLNLIA